MNFCHFEKWYVLTQLNLEPKCDAWSILKQKFTFSLSFSIVDFLSSFSKVKYWNFLRTVLGTSLVKQIVACICKSSIVDKRAALCRWLRFAKFYCSVFYLQFSERQQYWFLKVVFKFSFYIKRIWANSWLNIEAKFGDDPWGPILLSFRIQSINLHSKSNYWK